MPSSEDLLRAELAELRTSNTWLKERNQELLWLLSGRRGAARPSSEQRVASSEHPELPTPNSERAIHARSTLDLGETEHPGFRG